MAKQTYNMFRKQEKETKLIEPQEDLINPQLQWDAYKAIEKQIEEAWQKLQMDVKKRAKPELLAEDRNRLMLLLAECNFIARECSKWTESPQQRKKTSSSKSKKGKK